MTDNSPFWSKLLPSLFRTRWYLLTGNTGVWIFEKPLYTPPNPLCPSLCSSLKKICITDSAYEYFQGPLPLSKSSLVYSSNHDYPLHCSSTSTGQKIQINPTQIKQIHWCSTTLLFQSWHFFFLWLGSIFMLWYIFELKSHEYKLCIAYAFLVVDDEKPKVTHSGREGLRSTMAERCCCRMVLFINPVNQTLRFP